MNAKLIVLCTLSEALRVIVSVLRIVNSTLEQQTLTTLNASLLCREYEDNIDIPCLH